MPVVFVRSKPIAIKLIGSRTPLNSPLVLTQWASSFWFQPVATMDRELVSPAHVLLGPRPLSITTNVSPIPPQSTKLEKSLPANRWHHTTLSGLSTGSGVAALALMNRLKKAIPHFSRQYCKTRCSPKWCSKPNVVCRRWVNRLRVGSRLPKLHVQHASATITRSKGK